MSLKVLVANTLLPIVRFTHQVNWLLIVILKHRKRCNLLSVYYKTWPRDLSSYIFIFLTLSEINILNGTILCPFSTFSMYILSVNVIDFYFKDTYN